MIAVNLLDLGDQPYAISSLLLGPYLTQNRVYPRGRQEVDSAYLTLSLEHDSDQWDAIRHIIREGLGKLPPTPRHKLRIFERHDGKWVPV